MIENRKSFLDQKSNLKVQQKNGPSFLSLGTNTRKNTSWEAQALLDSCSEELRHSLSRTTGGTHFAKTEPQLLALIKQLAVRYQNPAVHVQEFLGLVQHQDEGVRHFVTRLRGVAARCKLLWKGW